jgi:hypothetical protein
MNRNYLIAAAVSAAVITFALLDRSSTATMTMPYAQSVVGPRPAAPLPVTSPETPEGAAADNGAGAEDVVSTKWETIIARARAGDPRAQFKLGDKLHECVGMVGLAERGMANEVADECATIPAVQPADWRYWHDKAIAAGDPMALIYEAIELRDKLKMDTAIEVAARSHDPEAQRALGWMLLSVVEHPDPIDGLAWMLVACGDCMVDDPERGFTPCIHSGDCPTNTPMLEYFASDPELAPVVQEISARAESLRQMYGE